MPVVLTWTGSQTEAKKGLRPYGVIQGPKVQAWNFFHLNYYKSWYIKTPMPATLPWTLAQAVTQKLFVASAASWRKPKHKQERMLWPAVRQMHGSSTEKDFDYILLWLYILIIIIYIL